jgi:hypothetical protein
MISCAFELPVVPKAAEKYEKMYLPGLASPPIFVSESEKKRSLKRVNTKTTGSLILFFLLLFTSLPAQQIWPGDINNNGIVNNIDVLYWNLAREATGPVRDGGSADWIGQDITELWGEEFPDGLNFAFADCNGDGVVDDDDLAIIRDNFGLTHGLVSSDEYFLGEAGQDPLLLLEAENPVTSGGATEILPLSLGEVGDSVYNFMGIAFTINFDPENIKNSMGGSNQNFNFAFTPDSWVNGPIPGPQLGRFFLHVDDEAGVAQVAILRRNANNLVEAAAGRVGQFSIVMEDIIVGLTTLEIDSIRMVDNQLNSTKIAPSSVLLAEDPALQTAAEDLAAETLRLYPNPTNAWLTLELNAAPDTYIQQVDVYTMSGQQLTRLTAARPAPTVMIDLSTLPDGMYLLKIKTDRGFILRKAVKMPR